MTELPNLLHEYFDRLWRACPDQIALDIPPGRDRGERVRTSYAGLARRSFAVTAAVEAFVTGECLVAVLLPRTTPDAYAAPIGILRAGAGFTALDPAFPDDRLADVLDDARAAALVTDRAGADRVRRIGVDPARVIVVDGMRSDAGPYVGPYVGRTELRSANEADPAIAPSAPPWLTPSSLAYAIYTSGTTGRPKGVMIEHRAIVNLVQRDLEEFRLSSADRVGHGSSHAYDSSIEEAWLAFAAGATLVVLDDMVVRAGPDLVPWLEREGVTVLCPPPTLLRAMGRRHADGLLPRLSLLYVGGEALTRDVADVWAPGRRLVNGYGPTECAVTAIRGPVGARGVIDIGRPIPGVQAWVLDDTLDEVADGERGELCLGGVGLARGYRNAPELTAQRFPVHPRLGRIYRTGDLAYRGPNGAFVCLGRIDAQVKIRGHRVELEEIETHLSRVAGVRAAACRVDGEGARQRLVAFLVPDVARTPPSLGDLRAALRRTLPDYMIPGHIQIVPSLPTTTGGKLDRAALPAPGSSAWSPASGAWRPASLDPGMIPASDIERVIESAVRQVAGRGAPVPVDDDFFADLGGDSLRAAELVTALRETPMTASLTVRDVYEAPTVRGLAARAEATPAPTPRRGSRRPGAPSDGRRPIIATVLQTAWLVAQLVVAALVGAAAVLQAVPYGLDVIGLVPCLIVAPFAIGLAIAAYAIGSLLLAVLFKRLLVGRYVPCVAPVWSGFFIRNWIVQRMVRLVPWRLLGGTVLQQAALRTLGARIGRRVHLHRGVDLLQGGWDLLEIGDDVTIGQDVAIRLVELDEGQIVVAPIRIGAGATLEVRAGVGGGAEIGPGAYLTALSMVPGGGRVPAGERWDGVPAAPAGIAPDRPVVAGAGREWSSGRYAVALGLARIAWALLFTLPIQIVSLVAAMARGADAADLLVWLSNPVWDRSALGTMAAIAVLPVPLTLVGQALAARWLSRSIVPGVISRWSTAYVRVWLVTGLVRTAGEWLSGALMWPWWLRAAGMTVGRDGEISTIIDVVPALVEVGPACFLADGIYLAGPRVHRGTVTLARTSLGANTFIGNHAVVACGQRLAPDLLIGVCTAADEVRMPAGSSWFGHPPFSLARPVTPVDRRLTHDPPLVRRVNRWGWELLRFAIPIVPLVAGVWWIEALTIALGRVSISAFVLVVAPATTAATLGGFAAVILALKWLLLGRVSPGSHPLWSCWCSRWDFLYVAWQRLAAPVLAGLEGTLWLAWYLRAMGARIGRRVVLGGGFAQVVDPDMLQIDDEATVHALFQAHTFEDRVLKIDRIRIRRRATVGDGAVLFYGADVGEGASVAPHSVVMKRERLRGGVAYEGCPIHPYVARIEL